MWFPIILAAPLSIQFYNEDNIEFTIPVTFSGKIMHLTLDTGSADVWARGTACKSLDGACTGSKLPESSTAIDTTLSTSIGYGDGSDSIIEILFDSIGVGGTNFNMAYGNATNMANWIGKTDGVFGIAQNYLNSRIYQKDNSLTDASFMYAGGYSSFGIEIYDFQSGIRPRIIFDGINPDTFIPPLVYIPVISDREWIWDFHGGQFSVNGGITRFDATDGGLHNEVVVDTGGASLDFPFNVYSNIITQLGYTPRSDGQLVQIPCADKATLPNLIIYALTFTVTIPGANYFLVYNKNCFLHISSVADDSILFGTPFFTTYYTNFVVTNNSIGIANYVPE